ncbi:MAG: phage tail sheath subtilisin-like domain-containing protein [Gemmatimonadaceae bacterium]|nr:phage tail sheath subtilisin-like domain-containing protein [Gemmatimonadaceae bacterium]
MATYTTPGVYYETVDVTDSRVASVRTDVAGFVGIAERGPVDTPVPLESWRQFRAHFGDVTGSGYLAYTVRAFFENGGARCWVVRVASRDPLSGVEPAAVTLTSPVGALPVWRVRASSPGAWGNALAIQVTVTHRAQTTGSPIGATPTATAVASTSGFERGTLVRLSQSALAAPVYRVVNRVDAVERQLHWVADHPSRRLPYDAALSGLDATLPVLIESVELTVVVSEGGTVVAVHEALSLVPEHPAYGPRRLSPPREALAAGAARSTAVAPFRIAIDELREAYGADPLVPRPLVRAVTASDLLEASRVTLTGGRDGLRLLTAGDFTGGDWAPDDSDMVQAARRRGFRALARVDEVAMLAVPDIHIHPIAPPQFAPLPPCVPDPCAIGATPPAPEPPPPVVHEIPPVFSEADVFRVQADLVGHCEVMRDRVALLDPPFDAAHGTTLGVAAIRSWRQRFDSNMAALHHPWVRVVDPLRLRREPTRAIPPSGHVAGQVARTDRAVGVHKAPANEPLAWAQDLTAAIDEESHGLLNTLGINVLRALPGRGIRILGARTVSSDPSWRFLPVRRLVLMVMKALDLASQWAVFEPNDTGTRERLRMSILIYLATLWQQGQLAGASMEEAFFVRCDETNNSAADVANGRLHVDIGIAPAIPFEFVVVRVWRSRNELELAEWTVQRDGRVA